ncbi:MAG TPA: amino acid permease [Burkholderiales bacterium]|jgi:ethanolamine permease|nr:amino acid permease [Burkholderiales bacterium]
MQKKKVGSVEYHEAGSEYFAKRELRRHARVWSLWALGVGAVISGHFSGWNFGIGAGGWGGLFWAAIIIGIMYVCLCFCLAEMSPALPHTGGAYSFARSAMGPWGGYVTGLAENIEYVLTPAVIVFFIGSYLGSIFGTPAQFQPVWWVLMYVVFVGLNVLGVELSFKVSVLVTLLALTVLVIFWVSAIFSGQVDFSRWALNIGVGPDGKPVELPEGGGEFLPMGINGILAALPFAVWLYLAIEELPLAAEESHDPKKDMPKGLLLGIATLVFSAFMISFFNASIPVRSSDGTASGAFYLGSSGEPLLDGFRALYGTEAANILSLCAVIGLIASFHTIIFAFGRQIYSLSRAGYIPHWLSLTHGKHKVPHVALIAGAVLGFVVMMAVYLIKGEAAGAFIGAQLLNMAVFGAMISYGLQGLSFIMLRMRLPNIERPYRSPLGLAGAYITILIAAVTLYMQFQDPAYRGGVIGVAIWYAAGIVYFAVYGRKTLVYSPEEDFAVKARAAAGIDKA